MSTNNARYTVSVNQEMFRQIEDFRFENRFEKDKIVHGAGSARRPYGYSRKKIDLIHRTKKTPCFLFFQCLFADIL